MNLEYKTEVLSLMDPQLQNRINQLVNEGWTPIPGAMPVGVYHLQRDRDVARFTLTVADEGITIIRGNGSEK
jgi:hypothetical protein